jgi:hypothetical protein
MKNHANVHASRHKASARHASVRGTPAAQAESADAVSQLAHAAPSNSDLRVNQSPRQLAQHRALSANFGPLARQEDAQEVLQQKALNPGKLNVAGETHGESEKRRDYERGYAAKNGVHNYWQEGAFTYSVTSFFNAIIGFLGREPRSVEMHGDPYLLRAEHLMTMLCHNQRVHKTNYSLAGKSKAAVDELAGHLRGDTSEILAALTEAGESSGEKDDLESKGMKAAVLMEDISNRTRRFTGTDDAVASDVWVAQIMKDIVACTEMFQKSLSTVGRTHEEVSKERSKAMLKAAEEAKKQGLWKIGNDHIADINTAGGSSVDQVQIMTKQEFNDDYLVWAVAECDGLAKKIATSATVAEGVSWVVQVKAMLATFGPEQIAPVRLGLLRAVDTWYIKSQGRRPSQDAMLDEQGLQVLK